MPEHQQDQRVITMTMATIDLAALRIPVTSPLVKYSRLRNSWLCFLIGLFGNFAIFVILSHFNPPVYLGETLTDVAKHCDLGLFLVMFFKYAKIHQIPVFYLALMLWPFQKQILPFHPDQIS